MAKACLDQYGEILDAGTSQTFQACLDYCKSKSAPDAECQAEHCYYAFENKLLDEPNWTDHCLHAVAKPGIIPGSSTLGCVCPMCSSVAGSEGLCYCPSEGGTDAATD
jgi:hypothetical protein